MGAYGPIDYDDNKDVTWKEYGETEKLTKPINLKSETESKNNYY
jgi:hypothetical protein